MQGIPKQSSLPYSLRIDTSGTKRVDLMTYGQAACQPEQAPKPQRPAKTVQLHRLDGTPYEVLKQPPKARFTSNDNNEQQPPRYQSTASYVNLHQPELIGTVPHELACETCGRRKLTSVSNGDAYSSDAGCAKCGKRSMSDVRPVQHNLVTAEQPRSFSNMSGTTVASQESGSDSVQQPAQGPRKCCNRCGKMRKPKALSIEARTVSGGSSIALPPPAHHIASQHKSFVAGLQMPSPQIPARKPVPGRINTTTNLDVLIDIIPPTAVSERPTANELSTPDADMSPLLRMNANQQRPKTRRSSSLSSIASSITRSVSKRLKQKNDSHEEMAIDRTPGQIGEPGAGGLFNMITNALRGTTGQDYSKLDSKTEMGPRPTSPFSFVGKEGDEIELGDMKATKSGNESPWEQVQLLTPDSEFDNPISHTESNYVQRPEPLRATRKEVLGKTLELPRVSEDDFLVQPIRPTNLTRFKSLRTGAQRAGSIARSASLKRLDSLKAAPQFWYRTDMAIEGAAVGVY